MGFEEDETVIEVLKTKTAAELTEITATELTGILEERLIACRASADDLRNVLDILYRRAGIDNKEVRNVTLSELVILAGRTIKLLKIRY